MDFKKYKEKFRKKPTKTLLKNYHKYNSEFRAEARKELDKRKVPKFARPYTTRKKTRSSSATIFNQRNPFW